MLPVQHAAVSGTAVFLAAIRWTSSPETILLWTVTGLLAGVLIDVDHALLAMVARGKTGEGLYWFRHPLEAITDPDAFLNDMDYPALVYHRLVTHLIVFLALSALALTASHPLIIPALIGIGTHIAADLYWDVRRGALP